MKSITPSRKIKLARKTRLILPKILIPALSVTNAAAVSVTAKIRNTAAAGICLFFTVLSLSCIFLNFINAAADNSAAAIPVITVFIL